VSAEYQQRQRALTVRGTHAEQVVAALRQAEAARAEVLAQRRGEFNRVAARFQRLQIEHRNARQAEEAAAKAPIARASNPPPSELAPQTARIEIQLGKLYPVARRLQAAMEEAQRELSAAEQATREPRAGSSSSRRSGRRWTSGTPDRRGTSTRVSPTRRAPT
jgi:hypothetical protein